MPFTIPSDLAFDQAPECLTQLRDKIAGCRGAARLKITVSDGRPTQPALEILFAASRSAANGAPLGFDDAARTLLNQADPTPEQTI